MNSVNRVKIEVNGSKYVISTSESDEYVFSLASELNKQLGAVLTKSPSISLNDALVLCAINYIDAVRRSEENADRMRSQLTDYLEEAAKARIELDECRHEMDKLLIQIEQLKKQQNK